MSQATAARQKEDVRKVYMEIAEEYDERLPGTTPNDKRFSETEMAFLLDKITPDDEVLDMGCGTGRFTIPIAGRAKRTTGLDICPNMIAQARGKADPLSLDINFKEADMANMPFEDNSFDVVTSMVALMHISLEERQKVFCEASRVLRPGGRMIISVKNSVFERVCPVDRFVSIDVTDIENKQLIFTQTKSGKELSASWYSFSPQDLASLFSRASLNLVHLRGNTPFSAWLSDNILNDPGVYGAISGIENILGDLPPFNHLGYYLLAEAVKPL
jgi:ubiquinone/menaquinone biosynthesis C-methylase UbiE